jgi:orotate phosphoribosyltransferase
VLVIDDVISAGTSVRESIEMIRAAGAQPCGVVIALDRQEKAADQGVDAERSAVQHVREQLGLEVAAIATLEDLLQYLATTEDPALAGHAAAVRRYRERYGV